SPTDPIAVDERFVSISLKEDHACALTREGEAYCWGRNISGEIGTGTEGDTAFVPVKVAGNHKWAEIHASLRYTCGLTFDVDAYCWGLADDGRLGNGETSGTFNSPVPVGGGHKFITLATGHRHACGIKADGLVY